ncbi:hypothetical protein K1T73_08250 [Roseovarius sp. SCSIO 43702]|uniref:hypothetical protein n=1 Tax=Roseovarius sp. SCSIO 43702 TaxID=2823043 RepID=UPI001C73AB60|nr:hypothetical protein [Roseovarius sp. SCSIO 43702]QYX58334.1 hypothetical protein K1T73_08250 [Roseovarius sp. SCSIO 43702]
MTSFIRSSLGPAFLLAIAPLSAVAAPMALTYDQFEVAVPHLDLETCPDALAAEDVFCRATLNHDEIHVFVFERGGDNALVGFGSFPAEGLDALLK